MGRERRGWIALLRVVLRTRFSRVSDLDCAFAFLAKVQKSKLGHYQECGIFIKAKLQRSPHNGFSSGRQRAMSTSIDAEQRSF
jgi:hypothetical protein